MQLFGIGPLELLLILVVAIIVLGPRGIVTAAHEAGKMIRKIIRSPLWQEIVDTSTEIRQLPRKIVREAGIEEDLAQLRESTSGALRDMNQEIKPVLKKPHKKPDFKDVQENEKEKNG